MTDHTAVSAANFDLICTLPLPTDLITLATHPTEPLLVIGLASGHVQAYRLPDDAEITRTGSPSSHESASKNVKFSKKVDYKPPRSTLKPAVPRRSSLTKLPPPPAGSHGTIETVWRTRRHKGSCRALTFGADGKTLFSAGTDGIIKAADAYTGQVVGKALMPGAKRPVHPSRLLALSSKCLVVGDDEGGVHEYELQEAPFGNGPHQGALSESRQVPGKAQPHKTHYPHRTDNHPDATDPITSLTALPPSGTSTSKIQRSWVSTAGTTLAVCDTFKGVVCCSEEQGASKEPLELLSSACVTFPRQKAREQQSQARPTSVRPEKSVDDELGEDRVVVVVGDSSGGCSAWPRGRWDTRTSYTNNRRNVRIPGLPDEDYGVECLAVGAPCEVDSEPIIVAGSAIGRLHFIRIDGYSRLRTLHSEYPHDDQGLDGCTAIAFDADGRTITGGGPIVKIWRRKFESSEVDLLANIDIDKWEEDTLKTLSRTDAGVKASGTRRQSDESGELVSGAVDDRSDDSIVSDDELRLKPKKRPGKVNSKKRKRGKAIDDGRGSHGILKVNGLA